jgi:hypothetical protein
MEQKRTHLRLRRRTVKLFQDKNRGDILNKFLVVRKVNARMYPKIELG